MKSGRLTTRRLVELADFAAARGAGNMWQMPTRVEWRDIAEALDELRGKRFEEANPGDSFGPATRRRRC